MRVAFALLMAAVMSVSLTACGKSTDRVIISKEEIASYSEFIELTTENWSDYIEISEQEVIEKDAFGEEIGRSTETYIRLKEDCYITEDNAIRLTYTRDNGARLVEETRDYAFHNAVGREQFILFEKEYGIVCEKIKGTIIKLKVPAEKWSADENGTECLCVGESRSGYERIYKDTVSFEY